MNRRIVAVNSVRRAQENHPVAFGIGRLPSPDISPISNIPLSPFLDREDFRRLKRYEELKLRPRLPTRIWHESGSRPKAPSGFRGRGRTAEPFAPRKFSRGPAIGEDVLKTHNSQRYVAAPWRAFPGVRRTDPQTRPRKKSTDFCNCQSCLSSRLAKWRGIAPASREGAMHSKSACRYMPVQSKAGSFQLLGESRGLIVNL
jgi:hypothetical protein